MAAPSLALPDASAEPEATPLSGCPARFRPLGKRQHVHGPEFGMRQRLRKRVQRLGHRLQGGTHGLANEGAATVLKRGHQQRTCQLVRHGVRVQRLTLHGVQTVPDRLDLRLVALSQQLSMVLDPFRRRFAVVVHDHASASLVGGTSERAGFPSPPGRCILDSCLDAGNRPRKVQSSRSLPLPWSRVSGLDDAGAAGIRMLHGCGQRLQAAAGPRYWITPRSVRTIQARPRCTMAVTRPAPGSWSPTITSSRAARSAPAPMSVSTAAPGEPACTR